MSVPLALANPSTAAGVAPTGLRLINGLQAAGNAGGMIEGLAEGRYDDAALHALGLFGNVQVLSRPCFRAGTPIRTPEGSKPIEQLRDYETMGMHAIGCWRGTSCAKTHRCGRGGCGDDW